MLFRSAAFAAFRRMIDRESTYVIAFAQARRAEERESAGEAKPTPVEPTLAKALDDNRALRIEADKWRSRANDEAENARVLAIQLRAATAQKEG